MTMTMMTIIEGNARDDSLLQCVGVLYRTRHGSSGDDFDDYNHNHHDYILIRSSNLIRSSKMFSGKIHAFQMMPMAIVMMMMMMRPMMVNGHGDDNFYDDIKYDILKMMTSQMFWEGIHFPDDDNCNGYR